MRNSTRKGKPIKRKSERRAPERMSVTEFREQKKAPKYRNEKTTVGEIKFDSKKEAERFQELKLLAAHGGISDLEIQPEFRLMVNGKLICKYRGDFSHYENGRLKVEDVKGVRTPVYRLKRKLMRAVLGIEIEEI